MAGPLMCWDLYSDNYYRKILLINSLHKIKHLAKRQNWKMEWDIEAQMFRERKIILVTDPGLIIRFASANLPEMNGYEPDEVLGKSPKIFQGKNTQPETRTQIREAIIKRIPFHGSIVNYRKNGTPYECIVEEYPVWSREGKLVNFIAFEKVA